MRIEPAYNVSADFFSKHGVAVMTSRELFEFVTDINITKDNLAQCLDVMMARVAARQAQPASASEQAEQQVRE